MSSSRPIVFSFFLFMGYAAHAQNVHNGDNLVQFANHLYDCRDYRNAIAVYGEAMSISSCNPESQKKLFKSCLFTGQYDTGILSYRSVYPDGLADNDTLELLYGKLLILNNDYDELNALTSASITLSSDQVNFLRTSGMLFSGNWNALQDNLTCSNFQYDHAYESVIHEIRGLKYKSPAISLILSSVIPGSGRMYAGYWYDGFVTLASVGIASWQAYRGFTIYGNKRPYTWIFASLSFSLYIGNLYGSYKSANMKNYSIQQKSHHAVRKVFDSVYNY